MAVPRQRIRMPHGSLRGAAHGLLTRSLWDGPSITEFERRFAEAVGAPAAVAMPSGRAGLRAILQELGLPEGAEVICPAYGYPVVPHLVRSMGFTLRLVECEPESMGIDPAALEDAITERTGAVIAMHLFGTPCRADELVRITEASGVPLIEDCAHCFGASVAGAHVGTIGRVGYFSFETSKMINTLGGGMITTDDEELAASLRTSLNAAPARTLSWLGKRLLKTAFEAFVTAPLPFTCGVYPALRASAARDSGGGRFASGYQADHFTLKGRTGRYTNYQARLGLRQLDRLAPRAARRSANAERLMTALADRLAFQHAVAKDSVSNHMLVTARVPRMPEVSSMLLQRGVDTKYHYMRDCTKALETSEVCPVARALEDTVLHLPAFPELRATQVDRIATMVRGALDELGIAVPRSENDADTESVPSVSVMQERPGVASPPQG